MASQIQTVEKRIGQKHAFSLGKRFLFIILICCIQMIYIPTSNRISGGIEPRLPFDIFPIWPVWVLPYVLCYPLWVFSIVWAIFKMDDQMFRSFILAFIVTCAISVSIFISFPTYVRQATLIGSDSFTSLLRFIHENWGRYNAFPSGHIYITALLALFFSRWHPRYKPIWLLIVVIVSLSTLFTAQHYVVDILGGFLVASIGYFLGLRWMGFYAVGNHPAKSRLLLPPPS